MGGHNLLKSPKSFYATTQMLLSKNIFSLNNREATKLNYGSAASFEYNISSLDCHKKARKTFNIKCESNVGHYSQLKAVTNAAAITLEEQVLAPIKGNGIGILQFFEGKNLLVTGATGFLAKALVEKILRTIPKINKIYLLIRAKDKDAAFARLTTEIMESKLFKHLEEIQGESYKQFILSKLIPVVGNVHEPNLGMDITTAHKIAEEVDLIIDSAANTTFDERYDVALDANVNGPRQLMMFAKKCKNLKLLMHYSTAYVNGEREGLILEKPFTMGESIAKEKAPSTEFPSLHAADELDIVSKLKNNNINNNELKKVMRDLGLERAKLYGWQDTYTFTKAIGEMMIDSMRDEIPVLILRPSIITSTWKEPFPGWIQGFRMADPLVFFYGKGDLPGFLCDPDCLADFVPVDIVVNATMAAIAKHGYLQRPELNVYHISSAFMNPTTFSQLYDYSYEYFTSFPYVNAKGDKVEVRKMRFFDRISDFSSYIWEDLSRPFKVGGGLSEEKLSKIQVRRFNRKIEYLKNFSKLYEPYTFYKGWFHNANMGKLMKDMSEEEKTSFEIDTTKIDWKNYFTKIHIPGVKEHVL